jgi:hypothetical protein
MTAVVADARPQGLNVSFRPGNTLSVELTWPTGDLAGRTFTTTLGGLALGLAVIGDVMTIEATEAQTAAVDVPAAWLLTETTAGATNDLLIGTWSPSTRPGTPTSLALTVTVDTVDVAVTVVSGQASVVALDARLDVAEADIVTLEATAADHETRLDVLDAPRLVTWIDPDGWDRFDEVPVSHPEDSTPVLTTSDGFGVATHGPPEPGGDDRRIYYLQNTDGIADSEVYLDWEIAAGNCQAGVALRGDDDTAVIVWSNIIFGVNVNLLQGVWEFDGTELLDINQDAGSVTGFPTGVVSAVGDGAAVTVRTELPHHLDGGDLASLSGVGAFGQVTVVSVPNDTSFTFASATAGSWSGGTVNHIFTPGRRKVGVRLIGDTIVFKQWLPWQDEPTWDDPDYAETNTLPATLAESGGPPPADGKIGILIAHLADDGVIRVNDLRVTNLDPLDAVPPGPVTDDTAALEESGLVAARVDDLDPYRRGQFTPADAGVVSWAYDAALAVSQTALTDGTIYLVKLLLREAALVSNILWAVVTDAGTPQAGQNEVALYDHTGARLGAAVDVTTASDSTGLKTTAITPVTVGPGFVWAAFLFNVSAGNGPSLARANNQAGASFVNLGNAAARARFATAGTGQTALPASLTPASNTLLALALWAAVS